MSPTVARVISIAGHPCMLALVDAAAVSVKVLPPAAAARIIAVVALGVLVPLAAFVVWQVRRGKWSDVDASRPADRPALFIVSLLLLGGLVAWLALSGAPTVLSRGVGGACAVVLVAGAALGHVKLSLHIAFATYSATVMSFVAPPVAAAIVVLIPFLAWSRLVLKRHSVGELVAGGVAGVAVALAVAFI